jgi:hypothetical protein
MEYDAPRMRLLRWWVFPETPDPQANTTMSSSVDTELISPGPERSQAALSVTIGEQDLLRLQVLATATGAGEPGCGSFAELLRSTLHLGIIESYRSAGLGLGLDPARDDAGSGARVDTPAERGSSRRTGALSWRRLALIAAAAATLIIIFGSYAHHWTWTGLTANGQVWDWLELLLLPVTIGTFPLWLRFSPEMSPLRRKVLAGAVLAFTAFVLAGYLVPLHHRLGHDRRRRIGPLDLPPAERTSPGRPQAQR